MSLVTILLAAFKGNEYVPAMIDSILAQDCDDWFLVLSDDGEDTCGLLDSYAAAHPDRITHYRSGQRFGSSQKHFMHLLCRFGEDAPYTMCCDQDDVWHPDKVRKTLALMEKTEAETGADVPLMVHTDLRVVDAQLGEIAPSFLAFSRLDGKRLAFNELLVQNVVTGCTVMVNRALIRLAVPAADLPQMMMHDWWVALIAAAFGRAVFLPEATMDYRQHGKNVVGAKNAGSLTYLKSRLNGQYVKKMRDDTIVQTAAFMKIYGDRMDEERKKLCCAMTGLASHGKLWRMRTLCRSRLWKNTLPRKAGQWLWW